MKYLQLALILVTMTCSLNFSQAQATLQDEPKLSLNEGTIDNQFEYVIRRSPRWQDFKN